MSTEPSTRAEGENLATSHDDSLRHVPAVRLTQSQRAGSVGPVWSLLPPRPGVDGRLPCRLLVSQPPCPCSGHGQSDLPTLKASSDTDIAAPHPVAFRVTWDTGHWEPRASQMKALPQWGLCWGDPLVDLSGGTASCTRAFGPEDLKIARV